MRGRGAQGGRRRAAAVRGRARISRPALLLGLVVAHLGLIGGLPLVLQGDAGGDVGLASSGLLTEPATAEGSVAADVRGGRIPVPGVRPVISAAAPVVPLRGSGTYAVAAAPAADVPAGAVTYRVEVERGLPFRAEPFARAVDRTLADARSWAARTGTPMVRVDGEADLRVVLASPRTTDELCAPLSTKGKVSCRNGDDVVINAWRWAEGAASYAGDLAAYRIYVVNHEVGHGLGRGHLTCTGKGEAAPVMLQQTLGLHGCRANPWPTDAEIGTDHSGHAE